MGIMPILFQSWRNRQQDRGEMILMGKAELLGEKPVLFHSSATSTLCNLSNLHCC